MKLIQLIREITIGELIFCRVCHLEPRCVTPREAFKAQLKSERSKHARSGAAAAAAAADNVDLVLNASCLVAHRDFKQQNPAKN